MTKEVDWNSLYKPFGTQSIGPKQKHSSGRELLQKAMAREQEQRAAEDQLRKAYPAMEALLKTRLISKTPLMVNRPIVYLANEMKTMYGQKPGEDGFMVDDLDDPRGSYFEEVRKAVEPGTKLVLKSLDHNLQEFIFENQEGDEVVIPYASKQALMTCTNIYEDVKSFLENYKGE